MNRRGFFSVVAAGSALVLPYEPQRIYSFAPPPRLIPIVVVRQLSGPIDAVRVIMAAHTREYIEPGAFVYLTSDGEVTVRMPRDTDVLRTKRIPVPVGWAL